MQKHEVSVCGALVYWNLGESSRDEVGSILARLGWDHFTPPVRSDQSALRNALAEQFKGPDKLVQSRRRPGVNGVELVDVERGEDENHYQAKFGAKVENGEVLFNGRCELNADQRWSVQALFAHYKMTLTGAAVGKSLVGILASLGGVAMRPSGGVYWIPTESIKAWQELAEAIEECGRANQIYVVHTIMDEGTVRAVRDALVTEITGAAAGISEAIQEGKLGERALETKKREACDLRKRVHRFAEFLGEWQENLETIVDSAEQAALFAAMQAVPGVPIT